MKNELTQSEKAILDLAVEWSMKVNGTKTMSLIETGKLLPAFNLAYQSFYEKASKLNHEEFSFMSRAVYIRILNRDLNITLKQ
jgi:hypothetical protein